MRISRDKTKMDDGTCSESTDRYKISGIKVS